MTSSSDSSFNRSMLASGAPLRDSSPAVARTPPAARPSAAPRMASSLWRHSINEDSRDRAHRVAAWSLFGIMAVLSIGSVAYAMWQTCALIVGGQLDHAVAAFLR